MNTIDSETLSLSYLIPEFVQFMQWNKEMGFFGNSGSQIKGPIQYNINFKIVHS